MIADSMPTLKSTLEKTSLSLAARTMVLRLVLAFIFHAGRMSCSVAAGAIASQPCHRAQLSRFTARPRWKQADLHGGLGRDLLSMEGSTRGLFLFILDATLVSQSGAKSTNTHSTGNRKRRPQQGRRYGKNKHAPKRCHSFTMGLLITPTGIRIPYYKPYYTREYATKHNKLHRTSAESAADLIRELPIEANADTQVIVLGDTAYEAQCVCQACKKRNYSWIVPANAERVYAGPKGTRSKVRSSLQDWASWKLQTIKVIPCQGPYAVYRRVSASRSGPKTKPRIYYAHQEARKVHSVGEVQVVFSTTQANLVQATPDDVKILLTNDGSLNLAEIVEIYSLRWQVELFFKELKSTLGMDEYQFKDFASVEGWVEVALTTFLYLESYRAEQLARTDGSDSDKKWWQGQRCHGLCQAVRLASRQQELRYIAKELESPQGIERLQEILRQSIVPEYRAPR